jgi:ribonuclease E
MLIDASHPEETRVVVLDGQKVEEFDFEAATKRPLKGNIYLAKVTRVEPSLQAAFVEYGGNRQGFLAFSEIHPDYYQIPVADRLALLAEQEAEARRRQDDEFESFDTTPSKDATADASEDAEIEEEDADSEETGEETKASEEVHAEDETEDEEEEPEGEIDETEEPIVFSPEDLAPPPPLTIPEASIPEDTMAEEIAVEYSADDAIDAAPLEAVVEGGPANEEPQRAQAASHRPPQRWVRRRHYKIQEVIKRRQVILVQVVKEERGNKGAALTTYLSLAGRYCVLMPNTPRGGGISRKITNANDRKRLKSAAQALELPEGMGLIIRTAGENRTKVEIKRDYEYLLRMWDTIREITLKSNAPACVYEEGDLIKRAIRDLYNKDVSEIIVEGEDGYRNAKDFMRMLMPSHAKNVKPYKESISLYQRLHIESQLDAMFSPTVTLKSGGYIVMNQTEALVAIDVNSGRATREHSIEDTAYKTNLEAAEEVARQLRLRDLAGLIVIDFIDMEDARNDRNVEKRLRDCVKNDRARVQIGKISQFGLLEMSRQRLRAGVVAGSTVPCPTCAGQGIVRSVESTALRVLRALDEEGQRQRANTLVIHAPVDVAMYTLNQKRREIARMEQDYGLTIAFQPRDEMQAGTFEMERIGQRAPEERTMIAPVADMPVAPMQIEEDEEIESAVEEEDAAEDEGEAVQPSSQAEAPANGEGGRKRRRRRRRGRDRAPQQGGQPGSQQPAPASYQTVEAQDAPDAEGDDEEDEHPGTAEQGETHGEQQAGAAPNGEGGGRRRRRRRRRGRRGGQRENGGPAHQGDAIEGVPVDMSVREGDGDVSFDVASEAPALTAPLNSPSAPVWSLASETPREEPQRDETVAITRIDLPGRIADEPIDAAPGIAAEAVPSQAPARPGEPEAPTRKGWWQRPFRLRE